MASQAGRLNYHQQVRGHGDGAVGTLCEIRDEVMAALLAADGAALADTAGSANTPAARAEIVAEISSLRMNITLS